MNKKEIEETVGKEIDDNYISLDKKIYAGKLYFYKREVEDDHYFYVPANKALYKMIFNPDNYNPSVTETGKYADSFQYPFDEFLSEGKIVQIPTIGAIEFPIDREIKNQTGGGLTHKENILKEMRSNCLKLAELQMNQAELINKLLD